MTSKTRKNHYETITNKIIDALESGTTPWSKPWSSVNANANLISGKAYRGINMMLLGMTGFSNPYWVTYKQAKQCGGSVRKGEKGTHIVYYQMIKSSKMVDGVKEEKKFPMMKVYCVFNVEQTEGVSHKRLVELEEAKGGREINVDELAVKTISDYLKMSKVTLTHDGDRAYYRPSTHAVNLPNQSDFKNDGEYYHTAFHEMGHSTGHKSLLAREGVVEMNGFGSETYSKEELIAELTACFCCTNLGVDFSLDNSASYIDGWSKLLRKDNKLIFRASTQAQKATDLILG